MKTRLRLLYYSFAVLCTLLLSGGANAQINYTSNFNGQGNVDTWDNYVFDYSATAPCQGGGAMRANLWALEPEAQSVSPSIGTSNGGQVTFNYRYKVVNYDSTDPTEATENSEDWGFIEIYWATSATGPFYLLETRDPSNHVESADCIQRSVTFYPPAGSQVYLGIYAAVTNEDSDFFVYFDQVQVTQAAPIACAGTPGASAAVASSALLCNGASVTLGLAAPYTDTGLTYQWQTSADNTTYTNVPTGGTAANYTTTQAATTWYRLVTTCTASGQSTNSAPVQVTSSGVPCPCEITFPGAVEPITLVNFAGINNTSSATVGGTPALQNFTSLAPAQVTAGQSYTITLAGNTADDWGSGYENYYAVYIDWNHDGDFADTNETYQIPGFIVDSNGNDGVTVSGPVAVPTGAMAGLTYMRVVKNWYYDEDEEWPLPYGGACGSENTGYGQAEDYIVNVTVPVVETPDWVNLQWPATINIAQGGSDTVYARVYEPGVTEAAGAGAGITAWIGISPAGSNTNPATWTMWIPATFNAAATDTGNNDEYMATIGATLTPGTYYYASRFQLNGGTYVYGGYEAPPSGGGIWNGTTNISGVLTVTCATIAPVANGAQTFCPGATVANLVATGSVISWYSAATGGTALAPTTALTNGTTYHASVTPAGGCESVARTPVTVTITNTPAPDASAEQSFCQGATIADLEAEGDAITWYTAATGGNIVNQDAPLTDGTTYYAAVTPNGGCESTARTAVEVEITITPAPTTEASTQTFCDEADLDELDVDGDGEIIWYAAETGGAPLNDDMEAVSGATYYAAQIIDGCESVGRTAVTVEITSTEMPAGDQTQEITVDNAEEATIADLGVDATGSVTWYATAEDAEEGENPLSSDTVLVSGTTYYATQTVDGCESLGYAVTATVTLGNGDFSVASFRFHPNPVKDVLTLSYDRNISSIEVYNIVGQQVMVKMIGQNEATVDMSQLSAGTYLVKVMGDSASKTIKVVKQ